MKEIAVKGDKRWRVVFKDSDRWLCGIYVPEFKSKKEITYLERHDGPEMFYLIDGKVTLVLKDEDGRERKVPLSKRKLVIVDEWHNAYRPGGARGIALVIEKIGNKTWKRKT